MGARALVWMMVGVGGGWAGARGVVGGLWDETAGVGDGWER